MGAASTGVYVKFSADVADFLLGVEQIDDATAQSTKFQKKHADELDKLAGALGRVRASVDPAYAAELKFADAIAVANGALKTGLINAQQYADITSQLNTRIRGAGEAEELDRLARSLGQVRASVDATYASEMRFAEAIKVVDGALRAGMINEAQYAEITARLNKQIRGAGEAAELEKLTHAIGRVRASVDPALAAEQRFAESIGVADRALKAGLISEEQYGDLAERLENQILGAGSAGRRAAHGIEEMSLHTVGAKREIMVLGHEVLTGRFSRIPGSLMVLAERMGGVSLAAMGMAAAVAGVGVAIGEVLIRQEALDETLARATASLDNQGRAGEISRQMLEGYVAELDRLHGVSQAAAEQIVVDWSQVSSITPQIFERLDQSLEGYIVLTGEKAPAAAHQLAQALEDPLHGLDELASHHVRLNADTVMLIGTLEREGNVMQARQVEADALAQAMQRAADLGMTPMQKATNEVGDALSGLGGAVATTQSHSVTLSYAMHGLSVVIADLRVPVAIVTKSFFDMVDVADGAFQLIRAGFDMLLQVASPVAAAMSSLYKAGTDAVHGDFGAAKNDLLSFPTELKGRYEWATDGIRASFQQMWADIKDMGSFNPTAPKVAPVPSLAPPAGAGGNGGMAAGEQALRLSHILDQDLAKRREIEQTAEREALIQGRIAQLQHEQAGASEARRSQIATELGELQEALKVEQQRKAAAEASEAKTDNGGVSRIAQWRGELAQRVADEATTRDQELHIAVQFWQQKLAGENLNAQETEAIHTALARAQGALARATAAEGARAAKTQAEGEIRLTQAQLQQAEKGSEERIALARKEAAEVKRLYGERSAEYVRAEAQVTASQRAYIDRQMQAELQERQQVRDTALAAIQDQQAALAEKARLGQIGSDAEIAQLRQLENRKYALEVQSVQDQLKLEDLTLAQKTALYTKLEQLARQHHQALLKLNQQQVQDNQRTWQQFSQPVISAFDTSVKGIVMGTQTIQQAVGNIAKAIVSEFVDMGVKMLTNWLVTQLEIVTGSEATALSNIGANAAVAASAAFASTAAIPMVGPELAPAAATAAYGQTMAWGAAVSIPSAAGGYDVPADTLAQIHKNEVVLPRHLAERFRAGADAINGVGGGGGFSPTIHFNANGRLTAAEIAQHADTLVAVLKQAHRNGAFAGARS